MRRTAVVLLGGLVAFWGASCGVSDGRISLPAQLLEMSLENAVWGVEADRMLGRLHRKDVAPTESAIGYYAAAGTTRAILYVSRFASTTEARQQLRRMADRIGGSSSGFGHHVRFSIEDTEVHVVLGQGQVHYFFASGPDLMWLGASPEVARPAVAELISASLEEIPQLEAIPRDRSEIIPDSAGS